MWSFFTQTRCVLCGLLAILASLTSGCATSRYGEQITTVNHYPQCYAPIQDLRNADSEFNKTIGISTGIGVLSGALIGFLASGGKVQGAAIGAAAGGVAGAGAGYVKARQDRIADDNRRMASYLVDLEGDITGIDRATAAARTARDCYNKQFKQAVADYKTRKISREELNSRYTEIKSGCTEAGLILGSMIATTEDKERDYQAALESESQRAGQPTSVAVNTRPAPYSSGSAVRSSSSQTRSRASGPVSTTGRYGNVSPAPAQTTQPAQPVQPSASAQPSEPARTGTIKKTSAPRQGDHSLEAVARSTQRLGESKQSAEEEKEALRKMQEEMDGTLATVLS